ncbi:MAG TPA: CPBP family intramembrane glutamic endopeptidase [Planctomycetaceae bacterium]|nr:CPBP family intramembrane glutamic endopeptidase [Planctomycetaceae bacterium]
MSDSDRDRAAQPAASSPAAPSDGPPAADQPLRTSDANGHEAAFELTDADFPPIESPRPARLPGPGLLEAAAWTAGTILVHVVAVVLVLSGLFLIEPDMWRAGLSLERVLEAGYGTILVGGEQLVFVIVAAVAVALRLRMSHNSSVLDARLALSRGRHAASNGGAGRLSLERIPPAHAALILCLVLPVALLVTKGHEAFADVWNQVARSVPGMDQVESARVLELLHASLKGASLPTLVFILAVLPAIGEELVFRGVVARGLTARWGLVGGVLLTSLLFAAAHPDPVHAVGVFPLGVVIHLTYLATRSFWAPVLYHFLNNSLAAAGLWAASQLDEQQATEAVLRSPAMPATVYVAAAVCAVSLLRLLWRTRVEHVLPDGTLWTPGYATAEAPPAAVESFRVCRRAATGDYVFAAAGVMAFAAALVHALWPAA